MAASTLSLSLLSDLVAATGAIPDAFPTREARPGMTAAEFYTPVPRVLQSRHRGKIRAEGGERRSSRAESGDGSRVC